MDRRYPLPTVGGRQWHIPTGQSDESYSYDENGNRTMTGYVTGENNRTTNDGTYTYEYDDEGNRTKRTKISDGSYEEYTWDHRNRLTKVTFKNSGGTVLKTVEHSYDVLDRWIRRTLDSDGPGGAAATDTFFAYEGGSINPVLQFGGNAAANLDHRYVWGPNVDQILADEDVNSLSSAGNVIWPLTDHLGTANDLADLNEGTSVTTVANHREFSSFGALTAESNPGVTSDVRYAGKLFDATTGLNQHYRRWLDVLLGQWANEDPIGFAGGDSNLRRDVHNNPLTFTDPYGLQEFDNGLPPHDPPWFSIGPALKRAMQWLFPETKAMELDSKGNAAETRLKNQVAGYDKDTGGQGRTVSDGTKSGLKTLATIPPTVASEAGAFCQTAAISGVSRGFGLADDAADLARSGVHRVSKNRTAYEAGVQLGRQDLLKRGWKETKWWLNPFEDIGGFGQGIDDVLEDSAGNLWIVEYKGGTGQLRGTQMNGPWVDTQIRRLLDSPAGQTQGLMLESAKRKGKLFGIVLKTPCENGIVGDTVELGRFRY